MNTKSLGLATLACAAAALLATPAFGQVVRETDTKTLAGLLDSNWNQADSFIFFSRGEEILFADLDAELFQVKGRRGGSHDDDEGDCGGHETETLAPAADDGHDDHDDSGGPGGLCLQVIDPTGAMICWADRPARPGWQRDPAIACPLPKSRGNATYTLRVSLKAGGCGPGASGGHDITVSASPGGSQLTPYLLNWSLRRIAPDGALQSASARSNP